MASDAPKADMVMNFLRNGSYIYGEGAMQCDSTVDSFMEGFESASLDRYSNYFEIQKFQFGVSVEEEEAGSGKLTHGSLSHPSSQHATHQDRRLANVKGPWANWRTSTEDQIRDSNRKYPLEPDEFSVTRIIDAASPKFFHGCVHSWNYESATLVKRISASPAKGVPPIQMGYFRIDFTDVLIKGVGWDDGDFVNETLKFICKGFKVRYRTQVPDSSLVDKGLKLAEWKQSMDDPKSNNSGRRG